jgi:hypothetical protein
LIRISCFVLLCGLASCGNDLYASCDTSEDCADLTDAAEGECLEVSSEHVCTWTCTVDADCESDEDYRRVCAPLESNEGTWCFPSCEDADVEDPDHPCPDGYTCRSTGGGSENQKFCAPGE